MNCPSFTWAAENGSYRLNFPEGSRMANSTEAQLIDEVERMRARVARVRDRRAPITVTIDPETKHGRKR